jgi:hypothetical protein
MDLLRRVLRGFGRGTAITALAAALPIGSATADIAAGRNALLHGDVAQAEAEWKRDAAAGNVEADFALGEFYEQIKGDYPEAERWYTEAAERGSIQARYRLALIALAGNADIAPDPIRAYKWALLASDSNNQWGRLAEDLRSQLEGVLSVSEQRQGKSQAELWRQQRTPNIRSYANAAPEQAAAGAAPDHGATPVSFPPGWPQGLECAAAAAQPPPRSETPFASIAPPAAPSRRSEADGEGRLAEAMVRVRCGSSRKAANLRGIEPHVAPPSPLCRSLSNLDGLRAASLVAEGLHARLTGTGSTLREGDPIGIEVTAGDYAVSLRIDYVSLDGRVLHMLPDQTTPEARLAAGATRTFGSGGSGEEWRAGGPPFGTELILVVATPQPLDLGPRPVVEDAAAYLSALERGLRRSGASETAPNLVAAMLVETRAR